MCTVIHRYRTAYLGTAHVCTHMGIDTNTPGFAEGCARLQPHTHTLLLLTHARGPPGVCVSCDTWSCLTRCCSHAVCRRLSPTHTPPPPQLPVSSAPPPTVTHAPQHVSHMPGLGGSGLGALPDMATGAPCPCRPLLAVSRAGSHPWGVPGTSPKWPRSLCPRQGLLWGRGLPCGHPASLSLGDREAAPARTCMSPPDVVFICKPAAVPRCRGGAAAAPGCHGGYPAATDGLGLISFIVTGGDAASASRPPPHQ